jgi:hypothetical protein
MTEIQVGIAIVTYALADHGGRGREPANSERSVDVRFGAHSGLKPDIA